MTNYLCLENGNTKGILHSHCVFGYAHLAVAPIVEKPTVTDEFPNGAHLGNIMKTIRLQREERNTFWEEKNKQRWVKEEARP